VRLREAIVASLLHDGVGAVSVSNSEAEALRFAADDVASKLVARLLEEW